MIRILLVDDYPMIRYALEAALPLFLEAEIVGQAGSGREAIERCQQLEPDVIMMDLVLPDMDGIQASQKILEHCPSVKIIILTTSIDKPPAEKLNGISAWMEKTGSLQKMLDVIREVSSQSV